MKPQIDLELPEGILFDVPRDYATNVAGAPVRLLADVFPGGVRVRWDDETIEFVGPAGGCAYRRVGIGGFGIGRRTFHGWPMCELWVDLGNGYVPVFYTLGAHESEVREGVLRALVRRMVDAGVPLPGVSGNP
jgi:hypothetical protein